MGVSNSENKSRGPTKFPQRFISLRITGEGLTCARKNRHNKRTICDHNPDRIPLRSDRTQLFARSTTKRSRGKVGLAQRDPSSRQVVVTHGKHGRRTSSSRVEGRSEPTATRQPLLGFGFQKEKRSRAAYLSGLKRDRNQKTVPGVW